MTFRRLLIAITGAVAMLATPSFPASAQNICVEYRLMPQTVFEDKTVTRYRNVVETAFETKEKTEYVPVYTTERRERVNVSYKPVKKTTMRNEEFTVYKPITETRYREETYEEMDYETVTEMRKEKITTEKPITETRFREETVLVRKPVRKTEMRSKIVTTLRPVQTVETDFVPGTLLTNQAGPSAERPRLDYLRRGYYWDATEGRYVWRKRGFHWNTAPQAAQTPVLVAQPRASTSYVPETTRQETPVEILEYDETIEVRKVPVEVERTEKRVEYRDVPVEVKKPIMRTKTRRIPYEETRYEKVVKVRQVPVETTSYEKVEEIEPYEKTTAKWVAKTREIEVPRRVTRSVPYQTTVKVPRTVMMKVPVDQFGNILGPAVPVENTLGSKTYYDRPATESSSVAARHQPTQVRTSESSVLERAGSSVRTPSPAKAIQETSVRQVIQYDRPRVRESGKRGPVDSIIVPETIPTYQNAQTSLIEIRRRPTSLNETSGSSTSDFSSESSLADPVRKQPIRVESTSEQPIRILGEYQENEPSPSDDSGSLESPKTIGDLIDEANQPPAIDQPKIGPVDDLDRSPKSSGLADPSFGI